MKDWLIVAGLIVGAAILFLLFIALVVSFYGVILGGIAGAAWFVFKIFAGVAP